MARLELSDLSKSYGKKRVLHQVDLSLNTGEILGIFGRNGSGKSTLLKILFGTINSDTIDLRIDCKSFRGSEIIKEQKIGYLPQFSILPKKKRVWDVIPRFFEDPHTQDLVFRDPGIDRISGTKIADLSQGELRYLELQLIANLDHPFLLLDEPYSMVEPLYIEHINRFLLKLKKRKGIIITDHYYHHVWDNSDRRLLLKDGKGYAIDHKEDLQRLGYVRTLN